MSEWEAQLLDFATSVITWAFVVEMGVKLVVLGWRTYWSDRWNALDGSIVSISLFEWVVESIYGLSGAWDSHIKLTFLRVLRILRVLRVMRLMRTWQGLYNVVMVFIRAAPQEG